MVALVVVMQAVTLIARPAEPVARVCRMEMSGPLAGTCAE